MRKRIFGPIALEVAVIGQGTWQFPTSARGVAQAIDALRAGIEHGMTHIDTAEMYGEGRSEEIVAAAIEGIPRESLFLVSKVLPSNANAKDTIRACEASLQRLKTDYLDCYLLHWRGRVPLDETMGALERLVEDGKIRALGVSNFDVHDLRDAKAALRKHPIACNQVQYHMASRGIEHAVIPYCQGERIAIVGYSPFGQGEFPSPRSSGGKVLEAIAKKYGKSARQVVLAFLTRLDDTFAIPKAADPKHVSENASSDFDLDNADVRALGAAFPLPGPDEPLALG